MAAEGTLLQAMPLVLGLAVGVGIGANDMATVLAPVVGGNVLSWRKALPVAAVLVVAGSALAGGQVFRTVGDGLVPAPALAVQVAVLAAVLLAVAVASLLKTPISTSQSIILALVAVALVAGQAVDVGLLIAVVAAWAVFPLLSLAVAPTLYRALDRALANVTRIDRVEALLAALIVGASGFAAFSLGANHAGLALGFAAQGAGTGAGPLAGLSLFFFGLLGGAAIAAGSLQSAGVVNTVGREITSLGVISAFVALATFGTVMLAASLLGLPVSTSQAMVASVAGVGLSKGTGAVDARRVGRIVATWFVTPAVASGLAVAVFWVL